MEHTLYYRQKVTPNLIFQSQLFLFNLSFSGRVLFLFFHSSAFESQMVCCHPLKGNALMVNEV